MDENKDDLYNKLESIYNEIRMSWVRDCDGTASMKELISIIENILKCDTLEEYFNNNTTTLTYFMGDFLKEVINNILIQPIIYGENGDQIAINLLYHIFLLFMKFHKNTNYAPLFEKVRSIFHKDGSRSFFSTQDSAMYQSKESHPEKKN